MLVKRSNYRLDVLAIIILLVFVALVSRLGYLQVVQGKYYGEKADGNRIRLAPIMAPRGMFYDRNGIPLVSNRPGFAVSLLPISGPVPDDIIVKVASILNIAPDEIKKKLSQHNGRFEPIRIKSDIGPDIVTRIEERRAELPGVVIEIQPIRNYINNELAAHLFGYVSEINDVELEEAKEKSNEYKSGDIIGKFGLEKVYDRELRGIDGGNQVEVDVTGRPVNVLGRKETVPGKNLTLTIDYKIQKAAEVAIDEQLTYLQTKSEFRNAKAAAAIAMNPKTGEILAMVSRPTFNPNLFSGGISSKDWKALNENPNNPMNNKAISGEYPPGSTFKLVTGAAALELGKVTPEEKILDTGKHWIIDKGNAEGEALGWINFKEALTKSDNVYFYEMGNRLGIDNLEKYARMFGLGVTTGINLQGESEGLVANQRYKEKVYGEEWYLSETFDAAIGQGFQLTTPLQVAVLMSEIANGGYRYRPYLVSKISSDKGEVIKTFAPEEVGRIQLSDRTLTLIRESLRDVALEGGTAAQAFRDFPIAIAGKTGTAENSHGSDHGWFIAYGPYEDPRIVVVVIVEQGGFGAGSAAPIARKIMEAAFNLNQDPATVQQTHKPHTAL
ncbi:MULTISPECIES: penicillin-binding protein 2 [Pelosinus]|uniref:Penicillin-binding protein 2 n=1 Tax=Pelosinus fermentans B4 TaxID=1149862 RepID=I9L9F1_9FIRM|nr:MULTISPECIES: penicillin-binding protein 2 [Pelosinus]EIW17024.1 penicillin-binding protein 2 [Pelosinus fermentans B4]EIW23177.1 penicillin-binding protein 2 [Pelosinus fermentans A11]OAM93780.1 penicillin-binding protein 2 [Pelosinus fermentans DSM 17108]SDQ89814.1 penicillin-binding protein 2 [Pelosinus fermentans]